MNKRFASTFMPIRSIPRNGRSITGRLVCPRTGACLEHESLLERDCLLLFSFDQTVVSLDPQPVRINFQTTNSDGRQRATFHIPDLLVRFHARTRRPPLLIEVKYHEQLHADLDKYRPKILAGVRYARERGWQYRVYTDRRIRGTRLRNIKFLHSFLREPRDEAASKAVLLTLSRQGSSSAENLLQVCSCGDQQERRQLLPCLWRLLANHEVGVDLDATPLSLATNLWPLKASVNAPQSKH